MYRYADFLNVREDFIPVFSEDVDKSHQANWRSFIPHDQMRDLLEKLFIALERGHGGAKRSLWLTGAYGTGKTFACFVIKHLLEDDVAEVSDYMLRYRLTQDLWPRLRALREGKRHLVIYRSASGHITSSRSLMIEIQQAIKDRLKARGLMDAFSPTLMDQILQKLTDTSGILNWEAAFAKYRGEFLTVARAEEVVERLRSGDAKLAETVAGVLEREGFTFVDSPSAIKAWIKEVIRANELQGIIFIWDEFTEFFSSNVPVTPLQELAHATADMPFYLFLVTHRALQQFTRFDEDTRRKLIDRFHVCRLDMEAVTAYALVANVIEVYPERRHDWETKKESLWGRVDRLVLHINVLGDRVNKADLKRMVPLHPFAAYLLATISQLYSSSQRTLFQFLKTDAAGSFRWFINNYPQEGRLWLTPDFLWQYFFEEDPKIESLEAVSELLSHYRLAIGKVSEKELAVLRATLLLMAMWRQMRGDKRLAKPALSVLKRMFLGTELSEELGAILEGLCEKGIIRAVPDGDDREYIIPTAVIDQTKLDEYRRKARAEFTLGKVLGPTRLNVGRLLSLQGSAKIRHPVEEVSAGDLKARRERILPKDLQPYQIGVILVMAEQDEHLVGSEELAREISKAHPDFCIVVSQAAVGARRWSELIEHHAHCWYYQEMKDSGNQRYYETKIRNLEEQWLVEVRTGQLRAFFQGRQAELSGCSAVPPYLREVVRSAFRYGPEQLTETATLYDHRWGKAGAEIGLQVAPSIPKPYSNVVDILKGMGLWADGANRGHDDTSVGQMMRVVGGRFAAQEHVNLSELWKALQQPPYGLMPSPIGILLFAFLLRSYANGYYYSDGANSLPLNPNKLADLVHQVMKDQRGAENYTIRKMSELAEQFCRVVADVFGIMGNRAAFPEQAQNNVRDTARAIGYPIWSVVRLAPQPERMAHAAAAEALREMLGYDQGDLGDREMQAVVEAVRPVQPELARLLKRPRMEEGMKEFLKDEAPQLLQLMHDLQLGLSQVMSKIRNCLPEDVYLWSEQRVKGKLPEVIRGLDLLHALNTLCSTRKQDLNDARSYFRDTWFKGKLPLTCYKDEQSAEIADLVDYVNGLVYGPDEIPGDNGASDIREFAAQLASLFTASPSVLRNQVLKHTGQSLSEEEAADLHAHLPDLSRATGDETRQAIVECLSRQARQHKIAALGNSWVELTTSKSPMEWSESRGVPIQWVMDEPGDQDFLNNYENLQVLAEADVDRLQSHVDRRARDLACLHCPEHILDRFIQAAAGEYADLVRQMGAGKDLHQHVRESLQDTVYRWPARLPRIQQLARDWLKASYREKAYPHVLKAIDNVAAAEMRHLLVELAADDPLVGARLLAVVKSRA